MREEPLLFVKVTDVVGLPHSVVFLAMSPASGFSFLIQWVHWICGPVHPFQLTVFDLWPLSFPVSSVSLMCFPFSPIIGNYWWGIRLLFSNNPDEFKFFGVFHRCLICRLPVPRPGQVLGLVGTNGIGKSTALKVLAGKLKPNLGRFNVMFWLGKIGLIIYSDHLLTDLFKIPLSMPILLQNPPDWQEILTYFRGSELQNYFTRILEDNLKVTWIILSSFSFNLCHIWWIQNLLVILRISLFSPEGICEDI